jgi:hypothetical protein
VQTSSGPQIPVQWVPGVLLPGSEASPPSSAEVKNGEIHLHSPQHLFHEMVLNQLSTGTILPLPLPGTCQQTLVKATNTTFHQNLLSGSRVVTCKQRDEQTDMTKVIFVTFRFDGFERGNKGRVGGGGGGDF